MMDHIDDKGDLDLCWIGMNISHIADLSDSQSQTAAQWHKCCKYEINTTPNTKLGPKCVGYSLCSVFYVCNTFCVCVLCLWDNSLNSLWSQHPLHFSLSSSQGKWRQQKTQECKWYLWIIVDRLFVWAVIMVWCLFVLHLSLFAVSCVFHLYRLCSQSAVFTVSLSEKLCCVLSVLCPKSLKCTCPYPLMLPLFYFKLHVFN